MSAQAWRRPRVDAGSALIAVLAVQFGAQPFLTKACIPKGVLKSSLVLATETLKTFSCIAILILEGDAKEVLRRWTFRGFLLAAGAPSLTYLVQSFCVQIAYQELDVLVFNVLNQTKMLSTAFFVYTIAGRGQSRNQCIALLFVSVAGVLVSTGDTAAGNSSLATSSPAYFGLGAMLLGTSLSGLGAGITERVLHSDRRNNYQLSAEMALVGCAMVFLSLLAGLSPDAAAAKDGGLFVNWSAWTIIPVCTQALGGILVGIITKLAGSVKKSFATIAGIVLTCIMRSFMMGELPSFSACVAVPLAAGSIYVHSKFPLGKATPDANAETHVEAKVV